MKPETINKYWKLAKKLENQNKLINFIKQLPSCETRDRLLSDIDREILMSEKSDLHLDDLGSWTCSEISERIYQINHELNLLSSERASRVYSEIWELDKVK